MRFGVSQEKEDDLTARMDQLGILEEDLDEQFIRASGPGGQKVNKTSAAVLLRHLPSGIVVRAQQARSQIMNRFWARRRLVEKLEAIRDGKKSVEKQRAEKIRRQKRRRSRRSKARMLADKRKQSVKKELRKRPPSDD